MKKYRTVLTIFVVLYLAYFSYFSIVRYRTLYSSYFDLGIMHQTVYNTFSAIKMGDYSRFLELTNPHGFDQVKRMAIHNDMLLALLSPFYFIYNGPETLLVIQSIVLGSGAFALFGIAQHVLAKSKNKHLFSLLVSLSFLFFPAMQRANEFDFHAVTLATTLLLYMFYFFLKKRYGWSYFFFALSVLSKEEVALSTAFFGIYILYRERKSWKFGLTILISSIIWFLVSILIIIPTFRSDTHFALKYYSDFGDSPMKVILGIVSHPVSILKYIWRSDTLRYFTDLLGPVGFLSLFSPLVLLIALPECAIDLFSNSLNMRNIFYHYTSVITPFIFISAVYGFAVIEKCTVRIRSTKIKMGTVALLVLVSCTVYFSYLISPLPFLPQQNVHPFLWPQKDTQDATMWKEILADERLKIMATGHSAPLFSSRRYLYTFSDRYDLADYVVLSVNEIYNYPEKDTLIPAYEKLVKDRSYMRIYKHNNFEVYRKKI